ncbi:unnamed protein product [Echinostoma caproni]|uniref:Dynein light chain n=1 Tax=Echinostoma caproni TaxID=27848 RepID=A0A183AEA4_9TREM|nr:unnamed protein product [Echinostoma caproni]
MSDTRPTIKNSVMTQEMQEDVIKFAQDAMKKHKADGEIAGAIKSEMEKKYGETWHVTVGASFGRIPVFSPQLNLMVSNFKDMICKMRYYCAEN